MTGWIILAAAAALLLLLLSMPVGLRFSWREEGRLALRIGPLRLTLYPPGAEKEAREEKPEKKKKKKKKAKKDADVQEKEERKRTPPTREQILYSVDKLSALAGRLIRRFFRGVRVDPLLLHLTVAGEDPADTAVLYGRLSGAAAALLPALRRVVTIRREDIFIGLDFQREHWLVEADVGVRMRLGRLLALALAALFGGISWYLGWRRLAPDGDKTGKKTDNNHKNKDKTQAPAA